MMAGELQLVRIILAFLLLGFFLVGVFFIETHFSRKRRTFWRQLKELDDITDALGD